MRKRIWLSLAHMSGKEQEFIQEAFDTNWVVPLGPNVDGFELDLQHFLGKGKHVVALSSGTSAIHLGLINLGVKSGDEVICQSFTFSASANPIKYIGARPIFVDSEIDTWNISPYLLEKTIKERIQITGKKPKAIVIVHLYGMPAKIDEIKNISNYYDIPIFEDAAEALGSMYNQEQCGTFGDYACLSFNGNKIITTSGGGALVCSTKEQADKIKYYATQARDDAPHYEHSEIGYNYRLSNICAGIGRGQMSVLDQHVNRRKEINSLYKYLLRNIPEITFQSNFAKEINSNYWLTCIQIDSKMAGFNREDLRLKMESENIETRPLWKPMHLQPVFADCLSYLDGTSEYLFENGLCLPSSPVLSNDDITEIANIIIGM